jgi:two-component system OmpR family sensor kinase
VRQQPEKLENSMSRIERECVRMDKLIDELLTLSRLEAGVVDSAEEEINISELIGEIVEDANFEAMASEKKVVLVDDPAVLVKGRIELLHRAIENVVRNAVRHTPAGGCVTTTVKVSDEDNAARIAVCDQGTGIAQAQLEDIFKPFFRGGGPGKSRDGHGLGLTIAKRVVDTHCGKIHAFNLAKGGLCVVIQLPMKKYLPAPTKP